MERENKDGSKKGKTGTNAEGLKRGRVRKHLKERGNTKKKKGKLIFGGNTEK